MAPIAKLHVALPSNWKFCRYAFLIPVIPQDPIIYRNKESHFALKSSAYVLAIYPRVTLKQNQAVGWVRAHTNASSITYKIIVNPQLSINA